jgi:hypothetical protein
MGRMREPIALTIGKMSEDNKELVKLGKRKKNVNDRLEKNKRN